MIEVLKANEIPAGARILNGQGRALTGAEVALGLAALVEQEVSKAAREILEERLSREWWPSMHLTFPNVRLEWCTCEGGIWLQALLGRNHTWEFRWNDEEADIREMKQIGPFRSPDEMRDALGLPRIAQFRTPEGRTFTAELPRAHPTGRDSSPKTVKIPLPRDPKEPMTIPRGILEKDEYSVNQIAEVPQLVPRPMEDMEVVRKEAGEAIERMAERAAVPAEAPVDELLADPPKVETAAEVAEPPKAAAKKVAVKRPGGKR